jgi:hypothetical protein
MFASFCGVVTGIINKIKKTSLIFHVSAPSASNLGYDLGKILSSGHGTFSLE